MRRYIKIFLLTILFFVFPLSVNAQERIVNIHLFYGDGCPHCAAEEEFLVEYLKDKPNVKLYTYEVWGSTKNQRLMTEVQKQMGNSGSGVPYTIIGKRTIIGYADGITDETIKKYVDFYLNEENEYRDYAGEITGVSEKEDIVDETSKDEKNNKINTASQNEENSYKNSADEEVDVPLLGKVNARNVSLPLLAVVLGFVDGFNPCAMWILIFLITMLFNMKNRKKMWILGLTFILTSGIVYLLFMLTWLNLATFISKISFIRLLIALVAIVVGIINLSKYITSINKKDEGCDVVDKKERKKIMNKIISITNQKKFIFALAGIIVLAASVNIVELMCSIGLPLIFTQILAMNDLSTFSYFIYMLIYILFFLLDDIAIFAISMVTLKVTGFSTKYTKYSHLIGGIILIIIGILMIIKPELLMFNF